MYYNRHYLHFDIKMSNTNHDNSKLSSPVLPPASEQPQQRNESVDSAAFFEGDEYDDYDDFDAGQSGGGGGCASNTKQSKRQQSRSGGGSGTIYSAKHVRQKEDLNCGTARAAGPKKK